MVFQNLDTAIFFLINKTLANPVLDWIMPLTQTLPYVFLTLLIIFFFFRKKDRSLAVLLTIAVVVSSIVVGVIKDAVGRERPYQVLDVRQLVDEHDNRSFPSNHAQLSFLLAAIVFRFYRKFGIILFFIALLISFGRIYLGVHYPSDVMGGALIGILLAILILKIRKRILT